METIRLPFKERACVFVNKDGNKVIVHPGGHVYDCTSKDLPVVMVVVKHGMGDADAELVIHPAGSWNHQFGNRGVIVSGDHCSYVRRPDLGCTGIYLTRATPDDVVTDKDYEECALNSIHDNMLNEIAHVHRASAKLSTYRVGIDYPCSAITVAVSLRGKNAWMRFSYMRLDEGVAEHYVSVIDNKLVYQGDDEHMYLKWLAESGHGPITTRVSTYDQSCSNSYIITVGGENGGAVWLNRKLVEENIVTVLDDRFTSGEEITTEERFVKFVGTLADIIQKSNKSTPIQGMAQMAYDAAYISTYPELDNFKFND